ncbi:MAG TPA: aldehyde dehydrogenase family protein, partial [Acidimicrobiia bacterium]|nr:aldehyde dehydrogenase family protein [Acidimicrobiia bacterium]
MDFRQFIGGEWVGAANGGTWELVNPATEEIIDLLPYGDATDAEAALDVAAAALPGWSELTPYKRAS